MAVNLHLVVLLSLPGRRGNPSASCSRFLVFLLSCSLALVQLSLMTMGLVTVVGIRQPLVTVDVEMDLASP